MYKSLLNTVRFEIQDTVIQSVIFQDLEDDDQEFVYEFI